MNVRYCDFSNAKVGDKVFDILYGEGFISSIDNTPYPINVEFDLTNESYKIDGKPNIQSKLPTLYHNKFYIQIPEEAYK